LFVFTRLLVTWNRAVFEEFLPTTWAALLRILVEENEVGDIWSAWPALEATNGSGYWSQILPNLMKRVLDLDLSVFPAFPNAEHYVSLSSALIASEGDEVVVLRALTNVGLALVRLPRHLQSALLFASHDLFLHPTRVSNALMVCYICGNCGVH
jgi:sacsin